MKPIFWCVFAFFVTALSAHAQIAPSIVEVSTSKQVTQGQSVSLLVSADGSAPLSYQWKKDGAAIAGATSSTYAIASAAVADAGSYTVTVSNSTGSVVGGPILLDVAAAVAPTFSYQPSNATVTAGDSLSLYAYVSGTSPLQFVWKKDNVTIKTATNDNQYYKSSVTSSDAGTYTVTVSNVAGSITSAGTTVTVNALTAPVFNSQPSDSTVAYGNSAYLYSSVTNSSGVTYQWYKDDAAIPGATSYYYYNATTSGSYKVIATNSAGSTTSRVATVTVLPPVAPSSLSISSSQVKVVVGEYFSLYASASGTSPFTFQWRKDGKDIPGATSYYYSKSNVTVDDTGSYSVVVSNIAGSATSSSAFVSIASPLPPVITQQPTSVGVYPGDYVSLNVSAVGTGTVRYQWKKDGTSIPGATSSTYYVSNSAVSSDAGSYTVVVSNDYGIVVSTPATVTVFASTTPQITSQPSNTSVVTGQTVSLSVSAIGHPAPSYQWKKDGVSVPGATSSSYYKGNAAADDAGTYTVVVSNTAGSVTSSGATVSVVSAAALVITEHPASFSVPVGSSSYYGLSVGYQYTSWSGPYTIDWYLDDVLIPGAHYSTYYISNAQPEQAGTYKAKLTNTSGTVTTYGAVVSVDLSSARPVIIFTSGSRSVPEGGSAYINIEVNPQVSNFTIQWKKDGVVIPNAFSSGLSISNFDSSLEGTYTAEVTTASGTYTSQPIALSLLENSSAPRIMRQPASASRTAGESVNFSVEVESVTPVTYQWRKNGVDIAGATGTYYSYYGYSISSVKTSDAGSYTVVLTNSAGSVTSDAAVLTVAALSSAPVFASQPSSRVLNSNNPSLWLSVSLANPSSSDKYQWYKDGAPIIGATSSSYSYYNYYSSNPDSRLAGTYKVVVTNSVGSSTSNNAVITVETPPVAPTFTVQPSNRVGSIGGYITFTAAAAGTPTITYQWRKDGVAIYGATGPTLPLTDLHPSDAGMYSVLATNAAGTSISSNATLTVGARKISVDFNNDGKADLIWQNIVTGERSLWLMNGTSPQSGASLGVVPPDWAIVGTGDFDGNGFADLVWQNFKTGQRSIWLMNGTSMSATADLGTVPITWSIAAVGDCNNDGKPDLVWENTETGQRSIWLMNGTNHTATSELGSLPVEWEIAGLGDFDGNGSADIVWQNSTTGQRSVWLMDGTSVTGGLELPANSVEWGITAVGDYNSDGKPDLVWQNTVTNQRKIWLMNGANLGSSVALADVSGEWRIGFGIKGQTDRSPDFNYDGKTDLLWQNTVTGERSLWLMNGTAPVGGLTLANLPVEWTICGTGDFDGNGSPDLVWQNATTGQRSLWLMNGTVVSSGVDLGTVAVAWSIVAVGDCNGDSKPDLVWENTSTGQRTIWLMNGATHSGTADLGTIPVEWKIAALGDFDANGSLDIVWQNTTTGQRSVWLMNGTAPVSGVDLGTVATQWRIAGVGKFNADEKPDIVWQNTTTGERRMWLMNGTTLDSVVNLPTVATAWDIKL